MKIDRNELDTGHYGEDQELGEDESTPAPWSVLDGGGTYTIQNVDLDEIVVWEMGGIDNHANAQLIAAAPELLDALERLVHMAECNTTPGPNTLAQARAAIAKVKGE